MLDSPATGAPASEAHFFWRAPTSEARRPPARLEVLSKTKHTRITTMAKTPSKKSAKAPKKAAGGKKKKTRVESYSTYIYRVLKQVHPDTGISKKGAHPRPDDATRAPDAHPRRARAPDTRTRRRDARTRAAFTGIPAQVVRRKLACQQMVSLDDAFTETRLPQ